MKEKIEIDGWYVVEEFLLTKGEEIVRDNHIPFKPLIDFAIILYNQKANTTTRLAMKFDLEKFFMRKCYNSMFGSETKYITVPDAIYQRVKSVNDKYRTGIDFEE